ncbi:MAG: protein tyrosine phosphatase family protein [Acidobacteria bacterium]|nr:protein tyrosine phosphatase family protein [Acidobacteriota bacterium]
MKSLILAVCAAATLFAQPAAQPAWTADAKVASVAVGQAPNSSSFGSHVYFAGQPTEADFAAYAKLGVKTVVNLRTPAEMERVSFDEANTAKAAGLKYMNVPVGSSLPLDGELAKIYEELNKAGNEKVLLHCASSNRVGMIWSLYRNSQHGVPAEQALAEGKTAGLKSPALEKLARDKLGVKP